MEEKFIRQLQESRGKFLVFLQDEVMLSNGRKATRDIVMHPGAVAILAVTRDNEVVLVKQYRYPVHEELYEIPAGKLEEGEEPITTARRELQEETGLSAKEWHRLSTFYTAPGFTNETMHLYMARDLEIAPAKPDFDEEIEVVKVPFADALTMMREGKIRDAKTMVALLWLQQK